MPNTIRISTDRPALGFEYEIALALIDTDQDLTYLTFADMPWSAIVGNYEVVVVTKDLKLVPPNTGIKPLRNGYNPAAQQIPSLASLGSLGFSVWDRAVSNRLMYYNGKSCVVRVITRVNNVIARTIYCGYWKPKMSIDSHTQDDVGEITVEGDFTILYY